MRDEFYRRHFGIEGVAFAFGAGRKPGFDRIPGEVHRVAPHISHLAAAEVPVHIPLEAIRARTA